VRHRSTHHPVYLHKSLVPPSRLVMIPPSWEPINPFSSSPSHLSLTMSPDQLRFATEQSSHPERKGVGASTPVQIPSSETDMAPNDLFSISLDSDSLPASSPGPSSLPAIQHELTATLQILTPPHGLGDLPYDMDPTYLDKGKARDTPPILPPLTFPPMSFDICPSPSLISEPGPSSYDSLYAPHIPSCTPPDLHSSTTHGIASMLATSLQRGRSFSNPLFRQPDHLIASSSAPTRVKTESSRSPNVLSHNRSPSGSRQTRSLPSSPGVGVQVPISLDTVETGSCFAPWKREFKPRSKDKARAGSYSCLVFDRVGGGSTGVLPDHYPVYSATRPAVELHSHKANARPYSDSFPLLHAFDVVPMDTTDAFVPIPIIKPPNLFDGMLPRELRLRIFGFLVEIREEDHARRVREDRWTANKASKHKWVGRNQGVREIMRLGRVSMRSFPCSIHGRRIPRSGLQGLVDSYSRWTTVE
jgi:F-box and leucine-rich repeat protein 2/20